jgi:hypothetical protein
VVSLTFSSGGYIWQYSPINFNELYIALEKYQRKDIAKLLKMDLHLALK